MTHPIAIFWFRCDLRLHDNAGLYHVLKENKQVLPLFIFDSEILETLTDHQDPRVDFIHQCISSLHEELKAHGSTILVKYGRPVEVFKKLMQEYTISKVYANGDYETYAINRDKEIAKLLASKNSKLLTFKDQVIFEKGEILKDDGLPYTVFTPYSRKWKAKLNPFYLKKYPTERYFRTFYKTTPVTLLSLTDIGFLSSGRKFPVITINENKIKNYAFTRDIPALDATTHLSVHLRFGTIGIRELVQVAVITNESWLNELIWREFFMMILYHFPRVITRSFKPQYDNILWRNNELDFQSWCTGNTGYPIVDAGMRELNITGFMHNRVRMITASFLCKHLLVDWRWGEAYFAQKLLDYDLSANNGNWQWVAGTGCDAAPYFRIFNPEEQTKKFDKHLDYVKKWVPEYSTPSYSQPIVAHKFARERCLAAYKKATAK